MAKNTISVRRGVRVCLGLPMLIAAATPGAEAAQQGADQHAAQLGFLDLVDGFEEGLDHRTDVGERATSGKWRFALPRVRPPLYCGGAGVIPAIPVFPAIPDKGSPCPRPPPTWPRST